MYHAAVTAYHLVSQYNSMHKVYTMGKYVSVRSYNLMQPSPVIYRIEEEVWELLDHNYEFMTDYTII